MAAFANPASMAALYYASAITFSISAASLIHLTLPFIVDGIEAGIDGAGKLAADFIERASEYAEAVTKAVTEVAAVTATAVEGLLRLPIFPIVKSNGPHIYAFDVDALRRNRSWHVLNYLGAANRAQMVQNRLEVHKVWAHIRPKPSSDWQLDEFPYASTVEGGIGAREEWVPAWENRIQGFWLSVFYGSYFGYSSGTFLVVPVPL